MDHIHTYEKEAKKEKDIYTLQTKDWLFEGFGKKLNFLESQRNNKKKLKKETDAALTYKKNFVNYKKWIFGYFYQF